MFRTIKTRLLGSQPQGSSRRQGWLRALTLACGGILIIGGGAWYMMQAGGPALTEAPLTSAVRLGQFEHRIVERGDVQSSSNVEVRSEVQLRSSNGVAILEIVPEGAVVKEGDFLVKLDDSALQNERVQQLIVCNASEAAVIQGQAAVETARLAMAEYQSGTFKHEQETAQSEVFVAEENLRRAEEYLHYSERLAAKGYITPIQLEADKFAVEKSRKELDVANTKLNVLQTFTRDKMLTQLDSDLKTAEAHLRAQQESHELDKARLKLIEEQIAKCMIHAPRAGQVVYANDSYRGIEIQEGLLVRERQVIIRLPDPSHMQVVAKINESRVDRVKVGMKAIVKIDALPEIELTGTVRRVSEYPLPTNSYTAHVKDYATEVEVDQALPGLRPGMTAEVSILVEQDPQALQVPLQAVFQRRDAYWCLLYSPSGFEAREVDIGSANEKFVVVRAGLTSEDRVVIHPSAYLNDVALPMPKLAVARRERARAAVLAATTAPQEPVAHKVHKVIPTADGATSTTVVAGGGR